MAQLPHQPNHRPVPNKKINPENNQNLKGTLVAVFTVGFIIIAMWAGVYSLFLSRM